MSNFIYYEKLEDYEEQVKKAKLCDKKDKEIERLKQGYCELKEKCNKGECDCTYEEYNGMCEQNIKMDLEIERLKDLCNKYEEEHKTAFEEWKKAINIINELEEWLDKKEKLTFNSWNKGIHEVQRKLQELKGSDKE